LITLLFLGGILGIAFELTHPGIVLPGLLGTVALLLALLGLSIVPFAWTGIALLVFGVALLALEGHSPAHGAFAAGGPLPLVLGGVLLFRVDNEPYGTVSLWLVLAISLSFALFAMLVVSRLLRVRRFPPRGGGASVVGQVAEVASGLHPGGQVLLQGERWQARLRDGGASARAAVRVTGREGLVLEVEREPGQGAERT